MAKTNAERQAANRLKKKKEGWWRPWIRPEWKAKVKELLTELQNYKD